MGEKDTVGGLVEGMITVRERVMFPENPFILVRVIVELPDLPDWRAIVEGVVDMLKAGGAPRTTARVIEAEWARVPLVALIMTTYEPGGVEEVEFNRSKELCSPCDTTAISEGTRDTMGPTGEIVVDSFTSPVNPLRLLTKTAEVALVPAGIVSGVEPEDMVKSVGLVLTNTSIAAESEIVPLDPWTTTV